MSGKAKEEEKLYFPLLQKLKEIFDRWYVAESYTYSREGYMKGPTNGITNPHLEITAYGKFSELLHTQFDYPLFQDLKAENLHPDIMGYVYKKDAAKREFITVEVKYAQLKIKDILQAKLYEKVFNAKFSFVISPKGIAIEKLKLILKHDQDLRGNVMIGQCSADGRLIRLYPDLLERIPKEFKRLSSNRAL
ncbi:MAG TPA: hypothetical protein VMS94_05795 [Acidobacteriota bacterium]|nr:hypothetical protein [Acidobacteriota bacterium]